MMFYTVFAALIIGLLLGFTWGRRSLGTRVDFGTPNGDGTFGPRFTGDRFFRVVPESLWAEKALGLKPQNCTRERDHDGPCNGWPCPEVAERMRAE